MMIRNFCTRGRQIFRRGLDKTEGKGVLRKTTGWWLGGEGFWGTSGIKTRQAGRKRSRGIGNKQKTK